MVCRQKDTSMVSYVDLLKTEGLDSENAPMYLEIIDEKTRRLRKLTEDLFEAAKASAQPASFRISGLIAPLKPLHQLVSTDVQLFLGHVLNVQISGAI